MYINFGGRKYFLVADAFFNDIKVHEVSVLSRTNFDKIYSPRNLSILPKVSNLFIQYALLYKILYTFHSCLFIC